MENSILLSFIIDACKALDDIFKKSLTYKFFIKVGISFKNSILGKILIKLFVKEPTQHDSFFINLIDKFIIIIIRFLSYIYEYFNKIKTSSVVYNLFNNVITNLKNCIKGSFIYKFMFWYFNN